MLVGMFNERSIKINSEIYTTINNKNNNKNDENKKQRVLYLGINKNAEAVIKILEGDESGKELIINYGDLTV